MNPDLPRSAARRARSVLSRLRARARRFASTHHSAKPIVVRPNPELRAWARSHPRPVSIVIPSYNDLPLLTECLASLERTIGDVPHEIIIVDDYIDPANSAKLMALENERVRVILKDERLGFAGTVNVGMAAARHDIVLLNSDIVALDGWLDALQHAAYAVDPLIGLVSPKLLYPDGRIQYAGTYYARLLAPQWFGHFHVGSPSSRPTANVAGYNRSISGACVYVTREAYERLGGLDAEYWLGFEDVDYGLTAWREGIRCYYEPAATLVHHESASRGYSQGQRELASMRRFWRRWSGLFLERRLGPRPPLDYVLSSSADELWQRYVHEQADAMRGLGYEAQVHRIDGPHEDPDVSSSLAARPSVKIACDWGAATTVWLGSLERGKPMYLLPGMETIPFGADPERQAAIVSLYRPEFDYVAPNRWTADQLRAEAAWEVQHRVVPALDPGVRSAGDGGVACVGDDAAWCEAATRAAAAAGVEATHIRGPVGLAEIDAVDAARPAVIVYAGRDEHPLVPLRLMSTGAAMAGRPSDRLRYEIMDGYNALLVDDVDALAGALDSLLNDATARAELGENGRMTAERVHTQAARAMSRAVEATADSAY